MKVKPLIIYSIVFGVMSSASVYADDVEVYLQEPPDPAAPNILFILDESGSMQCTKPGPWGNCGVGANKSTRRDKLVEALQTIFDDPGLGNAYAGLAGYSANYDGSKLRVLSDFLKVDDNTNRETLKQRANGLKNKGGTPTVAALKAGVDWLNVGFRDKDGNTRVSPIGDTAKNHWCRANHIVLLTDGQPNSNSTSEYPPGSGIRCAADPNGSESERGGGDCSREIAGWANTQDLRTDEQNGAGWDIGKDDGKKQNIVTHTIGFDVPNDPKNEGLEGYMRGIASVGGGQYYPAGSAADLISAFTQIIQTAKTSIDYTYTSPALPFDRNNAAISGDFIYIPSFKPEAEAFWKGNLKKYRVETDDEGNFKLKDKSNNDIVNEEYQFINSTDLWSASSDGGEPLVGGAAAKMVGERNLYTYLGREPSLVATENRVEAANTAITFEMLGFPNDEYRAPALNWLNWQDVKHPGIENLDGQMGASLHSKPAIVRYERGGDLILLPTTAGVLEAIDANTGQEVWAFMPQEMLSGVETIARNIESSKPYYGLDGPITVYEVGTQKYAVFGMRRGGKGYFALNVTSRSAPTFAWQIDKTTPGFAKLGQTWSKPLFVRVHMQGQDKDVLVFGGGYDEDQDNTTVRVDDDEGNAIFVINPVTGAFLGGASNNGAGFYPVPEMKNSIPSDILAVDINANGVADRFYVADVAGRVIRVDAPDLLFDDRRLSAGVIADVNLPVASAGSKNPAAENNFQRFFNTPEVGFFSKGGEQFLAILIGSGNRTNPIEDTVIDRFYMIRDEHVWKAPLEGHKVVYTKIRAYDQDIGSGNTQGQLYNASENTIQDGSESDKDTEGSKLNAQAQLQKAKGWFINFALSEKAVSKARLYDYSVLFTTYTGEVAEVADICVARSTTGESYFYAINMVDARAQFAALEGDEGDLQKKDRSRKLKIIGLPPVPALVYGDKDGKRSTRAIVGLEEVAKWPDRFQAISWEEVIKQ